MSIQFDDATEANALPLGQSVAVYYADGPFANETAVRERLPHAQLHGLTTKGEHSTKIAGVDCEKWDATPEEAEAWVAWEVENFSPLVIVYANASTWADGLEAALAKYGSRIKRWVAAYPGTGNDVPAGFDAHQWQGNVPGENGGIVDKNIALDNFFTHYSLDYSIFYPEDKINGVVYHERADVEAYDRLRKTTDSGAGLDELKTKLKTIADFVYEVAHTEALAKTGKTAWNINHRGTRYQELVKRSVGERFI
jgi:hypothetical protein